MDYLCEKHVNKVGSYFSSSTQEEVDRALSSFLDEIRDDMRNVDLLEQDSGEYTFRAAGSAVRAVYDLEQYSDGVQIDIEFFGSEPVVERFYSHFSEEWTDGKLSDI
jgi:hypothetical protein